MSGPFRLGPDELGQTTGHELEDALEAIDALGLAVEDAPVRTGPAFSDRVMGAIAEEPQPAPTGFLLPLRQRGVFAGFAESVRQAWASLGAGRPAFARGAALAYVLVVAVAGASIAGAATIGAAGALGLLGPRETVEPSPEPTNAPVVTPAPSLDVPTPSPSAEPSETPEVEASDDHGGSGTEPSDDHGGNSGPGGGSDDGSGGSDGSGSSGDSSGPSGTDDHGGSSGSDD